MKRWNTNKQINENRIDIDQFIEDIQEVCIKYKMSISHEDGHGSFIIVKYNKHYIDWLNNASFDLK
jgi:hypothetical protein